MLKEQQIAFLYQHKELKVTDETLLFTNIVCDKCLKYLLSSLVKQKWEYFLSQGFCLYGIKYSLYSYLQLGTHRGSKMYGPDSPAH